jgi:hypothetical protein
MINSRHMVRGRESAASAARVAGRAPARAAHPGPLRELHDRIGNRGLLGLARARTAGVLIQRDSRDPDAPRGPIIAPPAPGVKPPPPPVPTACPPFKWPPTGYKDPPIPAQYTKLDSDLVTKLADSYAEHDRDSTFLMDGFPGLDPRCPSAAWPQTLWAALDNFPKSRLALVEKVAKAAKVYTTLWNAIIRIRWSWNTSSQGFKFKASDASALETYLKGSPNWCRDTAVSEWWYHGSQDCWREVGKAGKPGLHVCLFANQVPDIHIDPTQIAEGREPDGTCDIDWSEWVGHAKDQI